MKSRKEDPARVNERFAKPVIARPEGRLIWLHAASVGESKLNLELVRHLSKRISPSTTYLLTCQTRTGAHQIQSAIDTDLPKSLPVIQQMAPLDTPAIARRFVEHWRPSLALFAEGEIWPNLLLQLQSVGIPHALLNARMTDKSILGWLRWEKTARSLFSGFDLLVAADTKTKTGLESLSGRPVLLPGNLKSALPVPEANSDEFTALRSTIGEQPVLLAASTHPGEEALVLDAYMRLSQPTFLIIAPRHPERGDEIDRLLSCTRYAIARRSEHQPVTGETQILLADTIGEMGLWYALADTVYLGGGHAPGIGGHNPLEALRVGKPVLTGPSLFNFQDLTKSLEGFQGFTIISDSDDLARNFPALPVSAELQKKLENDALGPMTQTLDALLPLLARTMVLP